MNNLLKKSVFVAVFVLGNFALIAQDTLILSLDSAINYALIYNKQLVNAKYLTQKSKEKIWETTSSGLPQINASVDYNNFLGADIELQLSKMMPATIIPFSPTSNLKLNLSQLIFSGNYYVGIQLSKLALKVTELSYQKTEIDIKEQVARAYSLILIAERTLEIIKTNKINAQTIYEKTNNLVKAGIIEKFEADKLSVMVTSVENAQKTAERQLEMTYNMLRLYLGLEADKIIKLTTILENISQQSKFETALTIPFKIENNFDYKLILSQEEIFKKQILFEKSSCLPTIAGYFSYTEKLLKPEFDMTPKNVVGFTMSIPIFSSGQRWSKINQAKINLNINENTKDLLTRQLSIQEKQLRFNLNNILEQYENQKRNIQVAKDIFDNMSIKYEQGMISSLELTNANSNYLAAEANYTGILFQLIDAEIALRKINGNL